MCIWVGNNCIQCIWRLSSPAIFHYSMLLLLFIRFHSHLKCWTHVMMHQMWQCAMRRWRYLTRQNFNSNSNSYSHRWAKISDAIWSIGRQSSSMGAFNSPGALVQIISAGRKKFDSCLSRRRCGCYSSHPHVNTFHIFEKIYYIILYTGNTIILKAFNVHAHAQSVLYEYTFYVYK